MLEFSIIFHLRALSSFMHADTSASMHYFSYCTAPVLRLANGVRTALSRRNTQEAKQ